MLTSDPHGSKAGRMPAQEIPKTLLQPAILPSAHHETAKFPDWDNRTTIWFSRVSEPISRAAIPLHVEPPAPKSHLELVLANVSRLLPVLACLGVIATSTPQATKSPSSQLLIPKSCRLRSWLVMPHWPQPTAIRGQWHKFARILPVHSFQQLCK